MNLIDLAKARRLRVRVQVPADDPVVPSLFEIWPGSEAWSARPTTCSGSGSRTIPT